MCVLFYHLKINTIFCLGVFPLVGFKLVVYTKLIIAKDPDYMACTLPLGPWCNIVHSVSYVLDGLASLATPEPT